MFQQLVGTACGFGCLISFLLTSPAEAQLVRVTRDGGGVHIRAPFVRVHVAPNGATYVRAPLTEVDTPGRYPGSRRRRFASPLTPTQHAGQTNLDGRPLPTEQDLMAMDEAALFATLGDVSMKLNLRLARFKTGTGWQRYLGLSEEAFGKPSAEPGGRLLPELRVDLLQIALARFDETTHNPSYVKVATLPSFIATQATLRQLVERFAEPQTIGPSDADSLPTTVPSKPQDVDQTEELPIPVAEPQPDNSSGERSILR